MKSILIGLLLTASASSFASDLVVEITFKATDVTKHKIAGTSALEDEKELSFLCGQLNEKMMNREFEEMKPEVAARTLEKVCKQELPEGYSWKLEF